MPPDWGWGPTGSSLAHNELGALAGPRSRLRRGSLCEPSQDERSPRTIGVRRSGARTRFDPATVPSALVDHTGALVTRRPAVPGA